jgi:hypothetical protein
MRIIFIILFSSFLATADAVGGWIDIQAEDTALTAGSYTGIAGINGHTGALVTMGEPMFGSEAGYLANRSELGSLQNANEDRLGWRSLNWDEGVQAIPPANLEGNFEASGGFTLVGEGQAGSTEPFLTTGTVALGDNSTEAAYSPRRLRMPEPLSLAVWAMLGAAWAGLAWHRRPSHRRFQCDGIDIEEGTRWDDRNRKAILQVIKKNRD